MTVSDVIDHLAGVAAGSPLADIRAQRPQARDNAQASYAALFQPTDPGEMSVAERHAVAVFVAGLHAERDIAAFYAAGLRDAALGGAIEAATAQNAARGPYGSYPAGPLTAEDAPGPVFRFDTTLLGERLSAAFAHAHMLVFHPRDASPAHLQSLLDAGWSTTGIVTLSQLVAFLSFQIRVVSGLRSLSRGLT